MCPAKPAHSTTQAPTVHTHVSGHCALRVSSRAARTHPWTPCHLSPRPWDAPLRCVTALCRASAQTAGCKSHPKCVPTGSAASTKIVDKHTSARVHFIGGLARTHAHTAAGESTRAQRGTYIGHAHNAEPQQVVSSLTQLVCHLEGKEGGGVSVRVA